MRIGLSLFLLALGAVLTFAVNYRASGVNLDTIGVILMVVGGIGLLMSVLFWNTVAPLGRHQERTIIDREVTP